MLKPNHVIVTFQVPKEQYERFKKLMPRYGSISSILRLLFQGFVEGKIKVK